MHEPECQLVDVRLDEEDPVFRYVVMFTFKDGTIEVQKEALAAALHQLPELIPEIRSYCFGRDLGLRDDNYEFAITADFDDADGFYVYSNHPDHLKAIAEYTAPIAKTRAAVQFEWPAPPTDLPGHMQAGQSFLVPIIKII